jgi:hypothetical protein
MSNGWFASSGGATGTFRRRGDGGHQPRGAGATMANTLQALPVLLLALMIVFIPLLSDGPPSAR